MKTRSLIAAAALSVFAIAGMAQAQEIPVAAIFSQSGPTAFAGVPVSNGVRLAIEQANQSGYLGKLKIKLIEGDYAGEKGQAISLANQAIRRDKVLMAFGPNTTPDAIASAPVFNEGKTTMFALATANTLLETGPWVFKSQQSAEDQLPQLGRYVIEKTNVRKIAIVYDRTNEGMMGQKNYFRDTFKAGGGVVVSEEGVASNESNFLPLVTKILSQGVDGVFFSTYVEQTGNLMVQLRQAGLPSKVRFFGQTTQASPKILAIAGEAAEGLVAISEFVSGQEKNKDFEAAYKARFKTEADPWAAIGYSMGQIGLRAIKDAGPNPDQQKVRDAFMKLRNVPIVAGSGTWSLNDRKPDYAPVMLQVKGGKFVTAP